LLLLGGLLVGGLYLAFPLGLGDLLIAILLDDKFAAFFRLLIILAGIVVVFVALAVAGVAFLPSIVVFDDVGSVAIAKTRPRIAEHLIDPGQHAACSTSVLYGA
jgi:hypothetical protein